MKNLENLTGQDLSHLYNAEISDFDKKPLVTGKLIKIVVAVAGKIAYPTFFLPYLYGEYGGGSIAHPFVCGKQQFADYAAALARRPA